MPNHGLNPNHGHRVPQTDRDELVLCKYTPNNQTEKNIDYGHFDWLRDIQDTLKQFYRCLFSVFVVFLSQMFLLMCDDILIPKDFLVIVRHGTMLRTCVCWLESDDETASPFISK
ncbi:hypothetical protein AVEN_28065-1 [Araneus ventricosus]|uniref:Uncharacterized protein n=1 Tax=Araneus ventricosus TaxID=182803 RepID=A0A4Y2PKI2_ARAVE|nr:hypothetical protein AVEN_28065-1 [Araneus ventricosus]